MTTQEIVRPSALDLTVKCPASMRLQASIPALPETDEQAEGHVAHIVALAHASLHMRERFALGCKFSYNNREWTIDQDMIAGATLYAREMGGYHSDLRLEDPVGCPSIHPQCAGTPDAWRFFPDARKAHAECPPEMPSDLFNAGLLKILRVGDYKYGHRYVEVFGNFQMTAYTTGIMQRLNLTDLDPGLWLELFIVQPRCYTPEGKVRVWRIRADQLRAYINVASSASHQALSDNPLCRTNDSCVDCKARHACTTLQYSAGALVEFSTSPEIAELPPNALGVELATIQDAIKRLEARATGLEAQAETLLRQGKAIPHFHLKPGRSVLTYHEDVDTDELVSFGDLINVNLRKMLTRKELVVTPTQALQLGVDEVTMRSYASRPHAALKLARDNIIKFKKVFSQ